jgi:hypothetical protein
MGRLRQAVAGTGLLALFGLVGLLAPAGTAAFDGFGDSTVDSTYGDSITFEVEVLGDAPERVELLVSTPGSEATSVTDVPVRGGRATYAWDTAIDYVTPNTPLTYRWRAIDGDQVTITDPATHRYDDDRPGLDWQRAQLGDATVHWYGGAEGQARRFGELTAQGVARAEQLLGTRLAGPVDVFVYDTREDFFGALGPGAREWTGAAAYSELRTIFMWLGGGSTSYLEVAMLHEVTHIVFHDATDNPFHEPARWLNEGIATWAETGDADGERSIVELEAGAGLFAFQAITEQFPIGERGGRLSYAQGATMVDLIVERHGEAALAALTAAYRDGASDAEALEAATGMPDDELYAEYYASFGVEVPQPIVPEPIPPSNVERPPAGSVDEGGVDPEAVPEPEPPDEGAPAEERPEPGGDLSPLVLVAVGAVAALVAAAVVARRAAARSSG